MGRHGAVGKMWRRLQLTSMGRLGGGIVQAKHVEDTFGGGFFSIHGRAVRHLRERVGGLCGGKEQAKHVEDILNLDIHQAGSRRKARLHAPNLQATTPGAREKISSGARSMKQVTHV